MTNHDNGPYKAVVQMIEPGMRMPRDIGKITLRDPPVRYGVEHFYYDGKWRTGYVDRISPENWEHAGLVPTIRLVMNPGGE